MMGANPDFVCDEHEFTFSEGTDNYCVACGMRKRDFETISVLEQRVERLTRALREIEAIDDPDDIGWIKAYVDWAFERPYDKRLDRSDAWMKDNQPEALAVEEEA